MLDPKLLEELAAHPERNSPDVNAALAEQGHADVLLRLVRSSATRSDSLAIIAARLTREELGLALDDGDGAHSLSELERCLMCHEAAPARVRDELLERHGEDAFFVLAASSHPRASINAITRAARWPARFPVLDRIWLALIFAEALPPLALEEWSQSSEVFLREAAARLSRDRRVLATLAHDPRREVRRAVASNHAAGELRHALARSDAAVEVRARASGALGERSGGRVAIDSARFAAAKRAMEDGGALAPDVANALVDAGAALDEEGAFLAARALGRERVVALLESCAEAIPCGAASGLALGLAVRHPADERLGGELAFRELMADAAKALSRAGEQYGTLTGKARLAAFIADALAANPMMTSHTLMEELCASPLASETVVLARTVRKRSGMLAELSQCAQSARTVPPALLELCWTDRGIEDAVVVLMARQLGAIRTRGRELPEDELDLDPLGRELLVLEQVVLAASRAVTLSPRSALSVVALDSRRVRYVLTAMPGWRGRLSGTMLGRVLRQHAGALIAGPAEQRSRGTETKSWTERILSDIELSIALAIGHMPVESVVERLEGKRHKLADGVGLAMAADARRAVAGRDSTTALFQWSVRRRDRDGAALAVWLLLEGHDRARLPSMIAAAIDSFASGSATVSATVTEALATLERRHAGLLETVVPQTPRGKAAHASGIARAYRAIGGLRDEH
ncbi:MAG: hypothetical protein EXR75_12045 [Myxococcales bacterium]|nr:hypothetical protein [Myxococcales bacterium]